MKDMAYAVIVNKNQNANLLSYFSFINNGKIL